MSAQERYLNSLYHDTVLHPLGVLDHELPAHVGQGSVHQLKTAQGASFSDWSMRLSNQVSVQGARGEDCVQMIACMGEGVAWETAAGQGTTVEIRPGGAVLYASSGSQERVSYDKSKDYRFKCVSLPRSFIRSLLEEHCDERERFVIEQRLGADRAIMSLDGRMKAILRGLPDALRLPGSLGQIYLEAKISELTALCLHELFTLSKARGAGSLSSADREALAEVKRFIDRDPASAPCRALLAERARMGVTKFSKGFLALYGLPVHAYIVEKRLELAAELLFDRRYTVGEVAAMVGWSNASHFAAAFKRKYEFSPKQLEKEPAMLSGENKPLLS